MKFSGRRFVTSSAILAIATVAIMCFSGSALGAPVLEGASFAASAGSAVMVASVPSPLLSTDSTPVGHAPAFVGLGSSFIIDGAKGLVFGPLAPDATIVGPSVTSSHAQVPSPNPKPGLDAGLAAATSRASAGLALTVPPSVSCAPMGPGCDSIVTGSAGATTDPIGINAFNNDAVNGQTIEPPDQGMCAGNGYVMEVENLGEVQIWGANFQGGSAILPLDSLMGLTQAGWSSGGDIQCLYDYGHGGHWFITEIVSRSPESAGGTFAGCFAGVLDGCLEGLAVSQTSNPTGAWNIYFVDPNKVDSDPGQGYFLNDFAKDGTTQNAFLMFYDEFNFNGSTIPACPAFGCEGFNGAQEIAIDKTALELGYPVFEPNGAPDPYFTAAHENMGTDTKLPTPAGSCFRGSVAGEVCWYQVIPAQSPDPTQFDNSHGGTGYMLGALDFFGAGDNRIAAFYWTGLSSLDSYACASCSGPNGVHFGGQVLLNVLTYRDEGAACPAKQGGFCGLGAQKAGPIPLGANCVAFGLVGPGTTCVENGIASNGDGFTQVSYAQGQIWGAVSTLVNQKFGPGKCGPSTKCEIHVGAAYYVIGTSSFDTGGNLVLSDQGYVTAAHEDLEFPSIAAGDTSAQGAIMTFTLSGNGGPTHADGGGFFPSTAFGFLTASSSGLVGSVVYVTDVGRGAEDGFTEYQGQPFGTRPRWGDYSAAIFVPGKGGKFYFADEYIEYPNCSPAAFLKDPSCGDTRAPFANWGSSINWVA
jgi:hypothetical protein